MSKSKQVEEIVQVEAKENKVKEAAAKAVEFSKKNVKWIAAGLATVVAGTVAVLVYKNSEDEFDGTVMSDASDEV